MKMKSLFGIMVNVLVLLSGLATIIISSKVKSVLYFVPKYQTAQTEVFPFQNTSLPWNVRVDDLVSRLTLEEIQLQMARGGAGEYGGPAPAIPRLGIGPYNWDTECLRGDVETAENATAFPQAIGLAATFSPELLYDVATAAGREVRGKHNDYVRRGIYGSHTGASCFSPVINIARDGRWGRLQETYGEDPYMSGKLAESFIQGLQGNHSRYVQATGGCKHFDVHAGPEDIPVPRETFNAIVSERDWRMTFLPAFRQCVRAGTFSVMCSYNRINGVPACANGKLLTDILRNEWNFTGYVVSDEQAIENIITRHHYLNNSVDTAAACVNAGCNLELSPNLPQPVYLSIVDAVNQGKLSENLVRERVKPLFYTRMRLGEFDPEDNNPYASLSNKDVETPEHQALAIEAAAKSFVLLKNQNNVLPLQEDDHKRVAIMGPMANNYAQIFGDYTPWQDRSFTKTPLEALTKVYPGIKHHVGCLDGTPCKSYQAQIVPKIVTGADLIFIALGTGVALETENTDRASLDLPGHQKDLVLDILKNSGNATVVVLLFNAGPLNLTFADESDQVGAILECFYPAQATGDALVNVLFNREGKYSPAGRLPLTWPKYDWQLPPMVNYSMEGRTYRYLKTDPLYPFGYGLSYSNFSYDFLMALAHKEPKTDLDVALYFTNKGPVDADEVVQCYISWRNQTLPVPQRQLVYFNRFHVKVGVQVQLTFTVSWESWTFWDNDQWVIQEGLMDIYCGGQQPNQKKTVPSKVLSDTFQIYSTVYMDKL
ncbi:xylan 1,4-beta-xylosidase-like isoform X1 [Biomphalaria glabrata]|uniref:Xylan 1,4-beta-xylosidase-like isoform X1 n=2 Tax=Biomphalaria glabrata TaxID=6526 RepID=A0A9W2YJS5_BIOGL|nr:xylan 1,4-beta-xylosidase-like isoform X1 [Biomphalaria glabrata]